MAVDLDEKKDMLENIPPKPAYQVQKKKSYSSRACGLKITPLTRAHISAFTTRADAEYLLSIVRTLAARQTHAQADLSRSLIGGKTARTPHSAACRDKLTEDLSDCPGIACLFLPPATSACCSTVGSSDRCLDRADIQEKSGN